MIDNSEAEEGVMLPPMLSRLTPWSRCFTSACRLPEVLAPDNYSVWGVQELPARPGA